MAGIWDETLNAINAYVDELRFPVDKRGNKEPHDETKINFAVFDSQSYDVLRNCLVKDWTPINVDHVHPRGMTPLYDSVARSIATAESIGATKTVIVVITDGMENSSKSVSLNMIKAKLRAVEDRGWQVVYLGAGFDNIKLVAKEAGLSDTKFMNFTKDTMVRNMGDLGMRTMSYASAGAAINYSAEDKARLSKL